MSSLAACRGHPKPGSEETSLAFPVLFGECPACFFVCLFGFVLFCFSEREAALGLCEKPRYVREGFFLAVGKGDTKRSAVKRRRMKERRGKKKKGENVFRHW